MDYVPKSYEPPPISKNDQTKTSDFNPIETFPYIVKPYSNLQHNNFSNLSIGFAFCYQVSPIS